MDDYKIDKFFKNKLDAFTESPPSLVWDNIYSKIHEEAQYKKNSFYKMTLAASIAFLLGVGFTFLIIGKQDNSAIAELKMSNPIIEHPDFIQNQKKSITNKHISPRNSKTKTIFVSNRKLIKDHNLLSSNSSSKVLFKSSIKSNNELTDSTIINIKNDKNISFTSNENKNSDSQSYTSDLLALDNVSASEVKNGIKLIKKKISKWILGGQASPTYNYRYIKQEGLSKDMKNYYNEIESGLTAYSGGINIQYTTNKRLSIKFGVYYSKIGQTIKNTYQPNYLKSNLPVEYQSITDNVNIKNSAGVLKISQPTTNSGTSTINSTQSTSTVPISDINSFIQSMSFIELPVLLNYKIIDREIDVNLIGGMGANIMVDNQLDYKLNGDNYNIGNTSEINKFNYNGTIGLGFEYSLFNNTVFSLEPTFKYYMSSINKDASVNLHPYSFGIFSGLSYAF